MKAGDKVDHYQLLKTLGHGGMGGVWIAFDPEHNDLVAVKTLFEEYADNDLYVKRFQREIDLMKRLSHPSCPRAPSAGISGSPSWRPALFD